ncbi:MAG: hypothetical protein WA347_04410 [Rhabdochlamydiaceae bacterium]|jgi:hypothetical protein
MSIYITNAKDSIINGTQNCLGYAKTVGSNIINSKTVQSNAEKISFVSGYATMRLSQSLFGKKQLAIPTVAQNNLIDGTHEVLDKIIGFGSSTIVENLIAPILDIVEPLQKGFSTDNTAAEELVSKYSFPQQILEARFKDFRNFILESRLHIPMGYFNHLALYDPQADEILILVSGHYVRSKDIIENFRLENRAVAERFFLPPFIVERGSNERFSYFDNGLTKNDVEKDIRPYKILPKHERPLKPTIKFEFCIDSPLEAPEDAANFVYHTWCEIVEPTGECYSFGLFGRGIVQCPDPSIFRKEGVRSIPFEITQTDISNIFDKIGELRRSIEGNYHFTKWNCATLMKEIASVININISDKDKFKVFDTIILRVKMYAISSILANLLRDPDITSKIGCVQELANLKGHFDHFPAIIKDLILNLPLEKILQSISIPDSLDYRKELDYICIQLKNLIEKMDLEKISKLIDWTNPVSPSEIKELCRSTLTGSVKELTYKIYNLFDSLVINYYEYELGSPGFVHDRLKQVEFDRNKVAFNRDRRSYITII